MKIQKRFITGFTLCTIAFFIMATAVFIWQIQRVKAVQDSELNFGIISLSSGQTARFNVAAARSNSNARRPRRVTLAFDVYSLGGPDTSPI